MAPVITSVYRIQTIKSKGLWFILVHYWGKFLLNVLTKVFKWFSPLFDVIGIFQSLHIVCIQNQWFLHQDLQHLPKQFRISGTCFKWYYKTNWNVIKTFNYLLVLYISEHSGSVGKGSGLFITGLIPGFFIFFFGIS